MITESMLRQVLGWALSLLHSGNMHVHALNAMPQAATDQPWTALSVITLSAQSIRRGEDRSTQPLQRVLNACCGAYSVGQLAVFACFLNSWPQQNSVSRASWEGTGQFSIQIVASWQQKVSNQPQQQWSQLVNDCLSGSC